MPHHGNRPHFEVQGAYLTILQGRPKPTQENVPSHFPVVAFAVDDLDTAIEKLQEHHITMPWDVENDGHTRWVKFYDPGGNLIELAEFLQSE